MRIYIWILKVAAYKHVAKPITAMSYGEVMALVCQHCPACLCGSRKNARRICKEVLSPCLLTEWPDLLDNVRMPAPLRLARLCKAALPAVQCLCVTLLNAINAKAGKKPCKSFSSVDCKYALHAFGLGRASLI